MVMEMSKTYQYRKVMKPLLERKRRARINKCLDDLKDLMVECLQQEGEHVTRLEKADILELTVEHMRKLKQRGALSLQAHSTAHVESFHSGYVHAADQITQVLLQQEQADEIGAKIMKFLSGRLLEMQHHLLAVAPPPPPPPPLLPPPPLTSSSSSYTVATPHLPALSPASSNDGCCFELNVAQRIMEKDFAGDGGGEGEGGGGGGDHHHHHVIDVIAVDERGATVAAAAAAARSPEFVWRPW